MELLIKNGAVYDPINGIAGDKMDIAIKDGKIVERVSSSASVIDAGGRLVMAGVDLRTVQELMGHKTIAMTLRYAHLSPGHLRQAVEGLCEGVIQEQRGTIGGTEKIACFGEEG